MTFVRANPHLTDELRGKYISQWDIDLTRALGERGGDFLPISDISVTDGAGGAFGNIDVHGRIRFKSSARETLRVGKITNATPQFINVVGESSLLQGQVRRIDPYLGGAFTRQFEMKNNGATKGDWMIIIQDATSLSDVDIFVNGSAGTWAPSDIIVTLGIAIHCAVELYFDGSEWRLSDFTINTTPGPAA